DPRRRRPPGVSERLALPIAPHSSQTGIAEPVSFFHLMFALESLAAPPAAISGPRQRTAVKGAPDAPLTSSRPGVYRPGRCPGPPLDRTGPRRRRSVSGRRSAGGVLGGQFRSRRPAVELDADDLAAIWLSDR